MDRTRVHSLLLVGAAAAVTVMASACGGPEPSTAANANAMANDNATATPSARSAPAASGPERVAASAWQDVTFAACGLRLRVFGTSKQVEQPTAEGGSSPMLMSELTEHSGVFASCMRLPKDVPAARLEAVLDGTAKGAIAGAERGGAKLVSQGSGRFLGQPSRELRMLGEAEEVIATRLTIVGGRMVTVSVAGVPAEDMDRVFASVQLVGSEPPR